MLLPYALVTLTARCGKGVSDMGTAKKAGKDASSQRKPTLHGSAPRRRMAVHAGTLRRLGQKPRRK